jgi:hypothetical protein
MNSHLRVTLVQSDIAWQDPTQNRRRLAAHFRDLAGHTDLIDMESLRAYRAGFPAHLDADGFELK